MALVLLHEHHCRAIVIWGAQNSFSLMLLWFIFVGAQDFCMFGVRVFVVCKV